MLVAVMAVLLFALGWFGGEGFYGPGGGTGGLMIAIIVWIFLTLTSYFSGDSIFLSISGARKIKREDHEVLWNVVEEMKIASGMPAMPAVYIIDDPTPNAFATGRSPDKASVAVTTGLLEQLSRSELQGVIAHEIGHIRNRDVLYMMMIGVMVGAIALLADVGVRALFYGGRSRSRTSSQGGQAQAVIMIVAVVLMILAPIIAQIVYFAVSRKREYLADASASQFTRYPEALASALEKISGSIRKPSKETDKVNRIIAPSYIINPTLAARGGGEKASLFSTHPPTKERIRILRAMAGGAGFGAYDTAFRQVTGKPVGVIPFRSLETAEKVEIKKPGEMPAENHIDRVRQSTDAMWRLNKYTFIPCDCGTKLKVPPELQGQRIICPHCGKKHNN